MPLSEMPVSQKATIRRQPGSLKQAGDRCRLELVVVFGNISSLFHSNNYHCMREMQSLLGILVYRARSSRRELWSSGNNPCTLSSRQFRSTEFESKRGCHCSFLTVRGELRHDVVAQRCSTTNRATFKIMATSSTKSQRERGLSPSDGQIRCIQDRYF